MTQPRHSAHATAHPAKGRRGFMVAASSVVASAAAGCAAPGPSSTDSEAISYQVRRSDSERHARLSDVEYLILRTGRTEQPKYSPLWKTTAKGRYRCKGCDLTSYDGRWKFVLDKGWVFFRHAELSAC